ncbi:MAG: hypothetical protein J1E62_07585 [Lachnospiraceae bacterium]|nr:hypothetical protein [Lachnospiraceae bacterium]
MDYQEAREYIDNIQESLGSDYSLREVTELARRMGNPEKSLKIIHIAGTNGKGSVGNFIANMLAASGYSVGRYVSPAVVSYRERIQRMIPLGNKADDESEVLEIAEVGTVSSHMKVAKAEFISRHAVARILTELRLHCEAMLAEGYRQPTAFEIETVMAFSMCWEWQVDFVILECGLGGETDATNFILNPLLCVVTSISRDHMSLLGDSIPEIAGQKYGIIKENSVVVSARQEECIELLQGICVERKAELYLVQEDDVDRNMNPSLPEDNCTDGNVDSYLIQENGDAKKQNTYSMQKGSVSFSYRGEWYRLSQPAVYQVENAKLAIEAVSQIERMGYTEITAETKKQGIRNSFWRGRFEILSEHPFILLDGAHNDDAMDKLCQSLETNFPEEKFVFVMGVFADKEYHKMIKYLLPLADKILTVTAPGKRGLSGEKLAEEITDLLQNGLNTTEVERNVGNESQVEALNEENSLLVAFMDSMEQALKQACGFGKKTVVCGSLSILQSVYEAWDKMVT